MKKLVLTLAAIGFALPAIAQEVDPAIDTDGDGLYSYPELTAAYPDMTEDLFTAIDVNADGAADVEEMAAAEANGLVPSGG
ncbi:EF-hand domain-containing protein [Aestuariibius insulae]|uniref:EF-hand domain-containing protein n=1 Tax=Aestuariibius insulae TaxID=2058287 RepID=UPI00345E68B0